MSTPRSAAPSSPRDDVDPAQAITSQASGLRPSEGDSVQPQPTAASCLPSSDESEYLNRKRSAIRQQFDRRLEQEARQNVLQRCADELVALRLFIDRHGKTSGDGPKWTYRTGVVFHDRLARRVAKVVQLVCGYQHAAMENNQEGESGGERFDRFFESWIAEATTAGYDPDDVAYATRVFRHARDGNVAEVAEMLRNALLESHNGSGLVVRHWIVDVLPRKVLGLPDPPATKNADWVAPPAVPDEAMQPLLGDKAGAAEESHGKVDVTEQGGAQTAETSNIQPAEPGEKEEPTEFRRRGNGGDVWDVTFCGMSGSFQGLAGLSIIAKLLSRPYLHFSSFELDGRDPAKLGARPSPQPASDRDGIELLKQKAYELAADRERFTREQRFAEAQSADDDLQAVMGQIQKVRGGRMGRFRNIAADDYHERARKCVSNKIQRVIKKMKAKGLKKLAEHLKTSIRGSGTDFVYGPPAPTPSWKT